MPSSKASTDKREVILAATLKLLSQRGFHGFSMKQLAAEAGVATGTIYLYFKDKERLIEGLHEDLLQRVAVDFFLDFDPELTLCQQFSLFCHNYWVFCMAEPAAVLSKAQFDHLPAEVLVGQRNEARKVFAPLFVLFERGREQGLLKNLPDEVLISLGLEPLVNLASKVHLGIQTIDDDQLEAIVQACWDAIARASQL